MKIVFHIGQAKTGTTSIQRHMFCNRDQLAKQGILYPLLSTGGTNHGVLTVPTLQRIQRSLVSKIGSDYNSALQTSLNAWSKIAQSINETRPRMLLISSEFFFDTPQVKLLEDLVRKYFSDDPDLTFLCYVRASSDWYASLMQQKLKASYKIPPCKPARILKSIAQFSSIGSVQVRPFNREQLKNHDIVDDFCSALNIELTNMKSVSTISNQSLSAEGTILLQEYRKKHHFDRENVFTKDTKIFISKIIEEENSVPKTYTKLKLKPAIAQFLDRESDQTREIKERFGLDLCRNHGVEAISEAALSNLQEVRDLVEFDLSLLNKMQKKLA
nr:hypothetical protein [uncultured Cohaesibacter sp.]